MGERYNGWTNYETWVVALWMGNEQSQSQYWEQAAKESCDQAEASDGLTKSEVARIALARHMQEEHEKAATDMLERSSFESGPFADLLRASLSEVNWMEIARHYVED